MEYKTVFTNPKDRRDLSVALELIRRYTAPDCPNEIIVDGLDEGLEIAEIGLSKGKVIIKVRRI